MSSILFNSSTQQVNDELFHTKSYTNFISDSLIQVIFTALPFTIQSIKLAVTSLAPAILKTALRMPPYLSFTQLNIDNINDTTSLSLPDFLSQIDTAPNATAKAVRANGRR
jgi:hypothetical protein